MGKVSLNVVPNVYNSLQSSFLSLVWPWWGRSLPKGNLWECWNPGLGPNVVRLPVHLPSPNASLTPTTPPADPWCPLHPCQPPMPPTPPAPPCWFIIPSKHSTPPASPWCLLHLLPVYPILPDAPTSPAGLQCSPDIPYPPADPLSHLQPMPAQKHPRCPYTPAIWECWDPGLGSNVVGLPVHLPPPNGPNTLYTPSSPQWPHPQPLAPVQASSFV